MIEGGIGMKSHRYVLALVACALMALFLCRPSMPKAKSRVGSEAFSGSLQAEGANLNQRIRERVESDEVVRVP